MRMYANIDFYSDDLAVSITRLVIPTRTDMRGPQRVVHGRDHASVVGYMSICNVRVYMTAQGGIFLKF